MSAAVNAVPVDDAELADRVARGAVALSMPLPGPQVDRFVAYVRLIERWNATYNLTAVRNPRDMVAQHILDCLAATAALLRRRGAVTGERLLDVGSGAGLPGLVIAAMAPEHEIVCIDSVGKKAAFITQAAGVLGLKNVTVLHGRVESIADQAFDVVASRAFASLADFVAATRHVLSSETGCWMAMKGKPPIEELQALNNAVFHVEPLHVPEFDAERCIVWIEPKRAQAHG
ncbi:MAG TPA: 16S rRNA (guanine(527)-N(7))-methyltransferase RsmG [Caldimonas sp.]|nr:16S rRNA (guanine(527)-N(7))-methyltransferase RsmG [Caldimonas sp.]HEV7577867.1 16S rRNA (guanine(527)-N(7))-methyltransferase RsmG [Caldimonas sp.]